VKPFDDKNREKVLGDEVDLKCIVNTMGTRHSEGPCGNYRYHEVDGEHYCLIESADELRRASEELTWLPYMLEFFWQNGTQGKGMHNYR